MRPTERITEVHFFFFFRIRSRIAWLVRLAPAALPAAMAAVAHPRAASVAWDPASRRGSLRRARRAAARAADDPRGGERRRTRARAGASGAVRGALARGRAGVSGRDGVYCAPQHICAPQRLKSRRRARLAPVTICTVWVWRLLYLCRRAALIAGGALRPSRGCLACVVTQFSGSAGPAERRHRPDAASPLLGHIPLWCCLLHCCGALCGACAGG